jgi:hypothetical protein
LELNTTMARQPLSVPGSQRRGNLLKGAEAAVDAKGDKADSARRDREIRGWAEVVAARRE